MEPIRNTALISAAGSGKTHALTKRFLLLLLHKNNYQLESLYAITFTNAAAFEMKSRIIKYLEVLSTGRCADGKEKDIWEYFGSLSPDIKERARKKNNFLLNNLSDLNVSTFHSMFASFLAAIPFSAGILPGYQIIDEIEEAIIFQHALDKYFEHIHQNSEEAKYLLELITDEEKNVKQTVRESYENLAPWFTYIEELLKRKDKVDREILEKSKILKQELDKLKVFIDNNISAAHTRQGKVYVNFQKFLYTITEYQKRQDEKSFSELCNYFLMKNPQGFNDIVQDFLGTNYIRNFYSNLPSPDEFMKSLEDFLKVLFDYITLLSDREIAIHLLPIMKIHSIFQKEKQEKNVLSFSDIETYVQNAFKNGADMDYLYFKLGATIRHLMIDEFQDTSYRQLEILGSILDEITAVDPDEKSLFYVGDPHQAIFRWRGGTPELFEYLLNKYQGKISDEKLDVNYRTKQEIVNFVNKILNKDDKAKEGNTGGWVRIENIGIFDLVREGRTAVMARVVAIIKELKGMGYKESDIAILTRKNDFAAELAKLLSEHGISCMSQTRAGIINEPDYQFMIHLLKFLDNPEDDFNLFHVLAADIFRIDEKEILAIRDMKRTLFFALTDFFPDWDATKVLRELLNLTYFLNPYQLIFQICQRLNMKISYPIATLLDAAIQYMENGFGSLSDFITWLEQYGQSIQVKEVRFEGVRIMTIHKAKGLEFEIVIIPDTKWGLKHEHETLIFSYTQNNTKPDRVYWRAWGKYLPGIVAEENERVRTDNLNLLYVALTRAKSGLYILGFCDKKGSAGFWLDTIKGKYAGEKLPFDEIPAKPGEAIKEEKKEKVYVSQPEKPKICEEREVYSPTERGIEIIEPSRHKGMRFGDIVHRAMSRIEWLDGKVVENVVDEIIKETKRLYVRNPAELAELDKRLKPILLEILLDPDLHFIFYRDNQEKSCKNEMNLYFAEKIRDVSIHIDRVVFEKQKIVIVDYKMGKEKSEYEHQLDIYKKGVAMIYPDFVVDAYLLFLEKEPGRRLKKIE